MSSKKRKFSGLSRPELHLAYNSLIKLKKSIVYEESKGLGEKDLNRSDPESFEQQVDMMLSLLGSKLGGPQSLVFSGVTMENLAALEITFTGLIALKPNSWDRITATTLLGESELWSSVNLYRHLHVLESLIPRMTEVSAHVWIDTFFFRVAAMLPSDRRMVLNMEQLVPTTTIGQSSLLTPSGFVDYTAIVASELAAARFLRSPQLHILKLHMPSSFFVIEAKLFNPSDHVPQAVCEMYACGKLLQTKILRGALTNGHDWIFLLIILNDNYDGASYKQSEMVQLQTAKNLDGQTVILQPWPDLIAAILLYWIENSFVDLESGDWFEPT